MAMNGAGAYVAWRREAAWALKAQRAPRLIGPIEVEIEIPRTARLDADNSEPALDALVDARVIEDDRHVRRLLVEKSGEPGRTTVRLRSIEGHKP